MNRKLMRLEEISEATGVGVPTLRWWRHRDRGEGPPTFKLGRRVVAYEDDVARWVDAQARAGQNGR